MIRIAGKMIDEQVVISKYAGLEIEAEIVKILVESAHVYDYHSMKYLDFEVKIRKSIVRASRDLSGSKFHFRIFKDAMCNEKYWKLSGAGGFVLRRNVKPHKAVWDIYTNSDLYGTECATAIVIVYFKAMVDVLPEKLFDKLFPDIYLYSWRHLDADLGIHEVENPHDYLPGDCRYFANPDHAKDKPEWQGENAIDLGRGMYYGHGMGIKTGTDIIRELNDSRRTGARVRAHLLPSVKIPDFKYLASKYYENRV